MVIPPSLCSRRQGAWEHWFSRLTLPAGGLEPAPSEGRAGEGAADHSFYFFCKKRPTHVFSANNFTNN